MPISRSAKKSLRKSVKNKRVNVAFKDKVKSVLKKYLVKPSESGLKEVFSMLDKAKKEGIFHKNKVARLKSTYSKKLAKPAAAKAVTSKKEVATKKKTAKKMA